MLWIIWVGFIYGGERLMPILQLNSAKVTSGDVGLRVFWGRLADVMGRYRHVTSAHPCQNHLQGLLPDVILAKRTALDKIRKHLDENSGEWTRRQA